MTTIKAYTNYFSESPEPITLLSYDNNKYVDIIRADGSEDSIKSGYIFKDELMTKRFNRLVWHCLGGGTKRNYKPRQAHRWQTLGVIYKVYEDTDEFPLILKHFSTKKKAVEYGSNYAKTNKIDCLIYPYCSVKNSTMYRLNIICGKEGYVLQLHRYKPDKYLRGYAKAYAMVAREYKKQMR